MKNKILTLLLTATAFNTFGYVVKMSDIAAWPPDNTNTSEVVIQDVINKTYIDHNKLMKIVNSMTNELEKAEILALFDKKCAKINNFGILRNETIDKWPETFAKYIQYHKAHNFQYGMLVEKYRKLNAYDVCTMQELADAYKTENVMVNWKNAVSKRMIKYIKIDFRKQGKSFVAKKIDGVLVNPMDKPLKELSTIINGPRVAGLNEFFAKYNVQAEVDTSFLPSDEEIETLKNDILIDEKTIDNNKVVLEKVLGVQGFNDFIKLYNDGVTK